MYALPVIRYASIMKESKEEMETYENWKFLYL